MITSRRGVWDPQEVAYVHYEQNNTPVFGIPQGEYYSDWEVETCEDYSMAGLGASYVFRGTHPVLGEVEGSYKGVVRATSQYALSHFMRKHPPVEDRGVFDEIVGRAKA